MANKSLTQYQEFNTNWTELSKIPEDHLAAVSILQYAVSEVNALRKIYLCQDHELTGEKATESATNIHRYVVLRTWSSRLFEAIKFVKEGERNSFSNNAVLRELATKALSRLSEISRGDGYETARDVRNEATNHYSFKAAQKNLEHVDASMNCNMYMAEKNGNDFFPMGEAVMFHARLNRKWKDQDRAERTKRFHDWLYWNVDANKWLAEVHASFVKKLVFDGLGRKTVRKTTYWVSPDFACDCAGKLTPVFFQDAK